MAFFYHSRIGCFEREGGSGGTIECVFLLTPRVAPDLDYDGDVDGDDTDAFQACATGPAAGPPADGCSEADFDDEGDVDQSDFGILQRCLSGAGVPAGQTCAGD